MSQDDAPPPAEADRYAERLRETLDSDPTLDSATRAHMMRGYFLYRQNVSDVAVHAYLLLTQLVDGGQGGQDGRDGGPAGGAR